MNVKYYGKQTPKRLNHRSKFSLGQFRLRIFCKLNYGHRQLTALFDSGCVSCFINSKLTTAFKEAGGKICDENLLATMANNEEIKIVNGIVNTITISHVSNNVKFYIMENLSQGVILGMDFLNKFNIKFLLNKENLLDNKNKIQICPISGLNKFVKKENKELE